MIKRIPYESDDRKDTLLIMKVAAPNRSQRLKDSNNEPRDSKVQTKSSNLTRISINGVNFPIT